MMTIYYTNDKIFLYNVPIFLETIHTLLVLLSIYYSKWWISTVDIAIFIESLYYQREKMGNLDAYQQNLSFNVIIFIKKRLKIS